MSTPGSAAKAFAAHLRRLRACEEAYRWAHGKSGAVVWRTCERGDWLLWLAGRLAGTEEQWKRVVFATCQCARVQRRRGFGRALTQQLATRARYR